MNGHLCDLSTSLSGKIAGLVRERGWSQKEFARRAGLSLQTVREILEQTCHRRLRNRTIFGCARALGMGVADLRSQSIPSSPETLHARNRSFLTEDLRYDMATQPQVKQWLEDQGSEAARYTQDEIGELLSMQGTGGPLTAEGLQVALRLLDRKRRLIERIHVIAGTEHLDMLESMVDCLFERVQPYGNAG
jgi:transcriptional regulator with XRE-family HTH domain